MWFNGSILIMKLTTAQMLNYGSTSLSHVHIKLCAEQQDLESTLTTHWICDWSRCLNPAFTTVHLQDLQKQTTIWIYLDQIIYRSLRHYLMIVHDVYWCTSRSWKNMLVGLHAIPQVNETKSPSSYLEWSQWSSDPMSKTAMAWLWRLSCHYQWQSSGLVQK